MLQSLMPWLGLVSALVVAVHQEPYILTGASVSSRSGSVPLRREISELRAEGGAQWFVYYHPSVLAMRVWLTLKTNPGMYISDLSRRCRTKLTRILYRISKYWVRVASTNANPYTQDADIRPGIHGKPFVEWNGAGNRIDGDWQGYCPHGVGDTAPTLMSAS